MSNRNDDDGAWPGRSVRLHGPPPAARGSGNRAVDVDVSWLVPADLDAVDALARPQVAASRGGRWLQFHRPPLSGTLLLYVPCAPSAGQPRADAAYSPGRSTAELDINCASVMTSRSIPAPSELPTA